MPVAMKRPVLGICVDCGTKEDEKMGESLFKALKRARKKREATPVFKLESLRCLDRCDTPCNVVFRGKHKPTLERECVDPEREVAALVDAMVRYAGADEELDPRALVLPGRPA